MAEKKQALLSAAEKEKHNSVSSRRKFLKKAAYSAPVVMALGQLVKPDSTHADASVPAPPAPW